MQQTFSHFIKGYLKIRITSLYVERFFNMCAYHGMTLWDVQNHGDSYEMFIGLNDLLSLRPILRKTGSRIKIIGHFGMPFFFQKCRKRFAYVVSLAVCALVIYVLTLFVWQISFTGLERYSEEELLSFLREQNIQYGMRKNDVSCKDLEAAIREAYNDILWVSASLDGTAEAYVNAFRQMAADFAIEDDLTVSKLAAFEEVLTRQEQQEDEQEIWGLMERTVSEATDALVRSRETEGEHLLQDLLAKLDNLSSCVAFIEQYSPSIQQEYRTKLEEKVREFLDDKSIDENRIAAEVTIFADKICVDEETVRLRSHIQTMRETLACGGGIGKKLDFLAQEMNREANTILSKSVDLAVSDRAITLKTEIEKIREQIQNVE